MKTFFEYLFTIATIIFVGYLFYLQITSHPSDKYHNDTWKEKRKNKYK